jgi:hypothetical protein
MNKDDPKLRAALAALAELIRATIESDEPGRFAVAARICRTAHRLAQESASRVDDFAEDQDTVPVHNVRFGAGGAYNPIVQAQRGPGQLWGDGDVMREAMGTFLPMLESMAERSRTQIERDEAETLNALLTARESVSWPQGDSSEASYAEALNKRIQQLVNKIEERNKTNAVVHPVVLRGHQAREDGAGVPADPGAADAARAAGGERAPQAGPAAAVARPAVGD